MPPGLAETKPEDWRKLFFVARPPRQSCNLHVRAAGRRNQRYPLLFRDYLRSHPAAALAYEELKRRLAGLVIDSDVYANVKDPACDIITAAAEEWAVAAGWQMGSSDA